jgi:hypothetical protein
MNVNEYGSFIKRLGPNFMFNIKGEPTRRNINAQVSHAKVTSMVSKVKYAVDFEKILSSGTKFEEISAYPEKSSKATIRITKTKRMVSANSNKPIRSIRVKFDGFTVIFYKTYFDIFGVDAWDLAKDAIIENGWATEALREKLVEFQSINGKFSLGKKINTTKFAAATSVLDKSQYEIKFGLKQKRGKGRAKMLERFETRQRNIEFNENMSNTNQEQGYEPMYMPELVKRKVPAVIIKYKPANITFQVFSSGIVLFAYPGIGQPEDIRNFFVDILMTVQYIFENIQTPSTTGNRHANRYPIARQLGLGGFAYKVGKESFTVIPPNGFYIRPGTNQKPRLYRWKNEHGQKLTLTQKNATTVAKAFANAKVPIPNHTKRVFKNEFNLNLNKPKNENKKVYANTANRRAPSWNATRNGFYVRPGPGKQPYWAAVPAGILAGRKTVIKKYTNAGVNIPKAVRNIFKIGNNVKTAGNRKHIVTLGNNDVLRINGRQVTRLVIGELLSVAKNLGIPQANNKSTKPELIKMIQKHMGIVTRQEKAQEVGKKRKEAEKVAKVEAKKAKAVQEKALNNELQIKTTVRAALGNKYTNTLGNRFLNIYRQLPSGLRGKPLKPNVNKALKKFVLNVKGT